MALRGARNATCHCQRATCHTNTERIFITVSSISISIMVFITVFITVSSISIVITAGPSAPRAVLIIRATTSARASA